MHIEAVHRGSHSFFTGNKQSLMGHIYVSYIQAEKICANRHAGHKNNDRH